MGVFLIGTSHLNQFPLDGHDCNLIQISGASIKGLLNANSETKLNRKIAEVDSPENTLVFQLGQVDIEFGYYYKSVITGTVLDKFAFCDDVIQKYEQYLTTLKGRIVVIGLNPTAITDLRHTFIVNFQDEMCHVNNLVQEIGCLDPSFRFEDLARFYGDTIAERNEVLKYTNARMTEMCFRHGFVSCDLWGILADADDNLRAEYKYPYEDHHIRPSAELTKAVFDCVFERGWN